ncbi:short-chain dehydrogenase [Mycobacteroides stephanolepidis]|uniref:Short-chain dehydrogenase n=1 Tax=[Mycobacterium] stephanolepidis TaxID=1520670 RepID=A0A1Z4ETA5_9MYCO|nr:SDR family NAD(P)-dependent oxidoreductase [[Mycobacterium] stephanolepidis]BAX96200.1 short-chain dehydrogenase [[Mycobacterium] stephanolepidis]
MNISNILGAQRIGRGKAAPDAFCGKIAVITGGGSGIGRSTAIALARLGAKVHVVDLVAENAETVTTEIRATGAGATAHHVDVTDPAAVDALATRVYAADGRVDILFNNAGVGLQGPVEMTSLDEWNRIINVNLMGVVHGVHAFVPRMLAQGGGGHIVNTASMLGLYVWPSFVPYATSKHAVVGLTEGLAAELGPRGIHATAICPGVVNTPIHETSPIHGDFAERRDEVRKWMNRVGADPDKVAEAVIKAIIQRQLICPVPRVQVQPAWALHRISPKTSGTVGRLVFGLIKPK